MKRAQPKKISTRTKSLNLMPKKARKFLSQSHPKFHLRTKRLARPSKSLKRRKFLKIASVSMKI